MCGLGLCAQPVYCLLATTSKPRVRCRISVDFRTVCHEPRRGSGSDVGNTRGFAVVSTRLCEDVSNSLLLRVPAFRARGVDLLAKDGVSLHLVFDFPDRVNHGRMIAASEELSDPHE